MIFTSPLYVQFIFILLLGYGLLNALNNYSPLFRRNYALFRIIYLLIFSLLFYSAWNPKYLLLMVWVSSVDFSLARSLSVPTLNRYRKFILFLSLLNSLGVLAIFKYLGFFQENLLALLQLLDLETHFELLRLVLPVGISFYIFQSISYIIEVYRGTLAPETNYLYYLFYLSFFPQLVAGPIVQAKDFLPQIRAVIPFSKLDLRLALLLILLGAFKKSVLADHLAVTSDFAFAHIGDVDRKFLWLGMISYSGQIYCDFSGYTDIAQGTALLFGFHLPENFRMPYLSKGFSDFWKRWHMSLSSWLKNYLYVPLGGNREGNWKTYRNLLIVMLLGGLWHGASWNFVFWGLGHGTLLGMERIWQSRILTVINWEEYRKRKFVNAATNICYVVFTFVSVSMLWIFFRSSKFGDSLCYLQGLFVKNGQFPISYTQEMVTYLCFSAIALGHFFGIRYFKDNEQLHNIMNSRQTNVNGIVTGALFSLGFIVVVLLSGNSLPFVYFVF